MTVPILSKIGRKLNDILEGLQQNVLATFSLTLVVFLTGAIEGSFKGVSYMPLTSPIRESMAILLGLPLYVQVTLRAVKSENRLVKNFITRNRGILGVIILPLLVYLGKIYPFEQSAGIILTFFILGYAAALTGYGTYIVFQGILEDTQEKVDFLDRLLFAALPAALATTLLFTLISYIIRLLGYTGGII